MRLFSKYWTLKFEIAFNACSNLMFEIYHKDQLRNRYFEKSEASLTKKNVASIFHLRATGTGQPNQPMGWPCFLELNCNFQNWELKVYMTKGSKDTTISLFYSGLALKNSIPAPLCIHLYYNLPLTVSVRLSLRKFVLPSVLSIL